MPASKLPESSLAGTAPSRAARAHITVTFAKWRSASQKYESGTRNGRLNHFHAPRNQKGTILYGALKPRSHTIFHRALARLICASDQRFLSHYRHFPTLRSGSGRYLTKSREPLCNCSYGLQISRFLDNFQTRRVRGYPDHPGEANCSKQAAFICAPVHNFVPAHPLFSFLPSVNTTPLQSPHPVFSQHLFSKPAPTSTNPLFSHTPSVVNFPFVSQPPLFSQHPTPLFRSPLCAQACPKA